MIKLPKDLTEQQERDFAEHLGRQFQAKIFKINKQFKYVRIEEFRMRLSEPAKAEKYYPKWMFWKHRKKENTESVLNIVK